MIQGTISFPRNSGGLHSPDRQRIDFEQKQLTCINSITLGYNDIKEEFTKVLPINITLSFRSGSEWKNNIIGTLVCSGPSITLNLVNPITIPTECQCGINLEIKGRDHGMISVHYIIQ